MKQFVFSPRRAGDNRAVPFTIPYTHLLADGGARAVAHLAPDFRVAKPRSAPGASALRDS